MSGTGRILYIGAAEVSGAAFSALAARDFPGLPLTAVDGREAARAVAADAEAMIGHHFQFDEDLVARAPRLRWIQSLTTGTDQILSLPNLRPEVRLTSARGMHGPQMSELVFLQMLSLLRDYRRIVDHQRQARWVRWPQRLLWGRSIGIVGVGAIAEALAPRCQAFGMHVTGVSGTARPAPPGFDRLVIRESLARIASEVDFLVLIVPYSAETESLVNETVIAAMRPESYLINVARGGVLDEQALLRALRAGRLAGAALDVFRQTPLPPEDPLWREPRLLITPHIGGMSDVYLDQVYPIVRRNLQAFLDGKPDQMINIVERGKRKPA